MGGSQSHEFMVASDAGEDFVVIVRRAAATRPISKRPCRVAVPPAGADPEGDLRPRSSTRPAGRRSPKWPSSPGCRETSQMKSLVMVADGKPVLALLRGDHQLSETKFACDLRRDPKFRPAHPARDPRVVRRRRRARSARSA